MPNIVGFKIEGSTYEYDHGHLANLPTIDAEPTENSTNAVQSGGVKSALDGLQAETRKEINLTRENTKNEFDLNWLTASGITVANGNAVGKASAFYDAFRNAKGGIPLTCKQATRYTLSGKAKNDQVAGATSTGLVVRVYYTDDTNTAASLSNAWDDYHEFIVVTEEGKTVDHIAMSYSSAGGNTWTFTDIQLEEGVAKTAYVPFWTAIDYSARNSAAEAYDKAECVADGIDYISDQLRINLLWENGTISGTGKNQTDSKNMRSSKIVHVKAGSKIWKTTTDIAVTVVTYSNNDLNTRSGSQQILPLVKTDEYVFEADTYCRFVLQNPNSHERSHSWANSIVKTEFYDTDFVNHELGVDISVLGFPSYLGNGIVFRLPNGVWFGIDSYIAAAYNSVKAIYTGLGVSHFDYFMISHYHQDHVGNIVSLINDGYIDSDTIMILPPDLDTSYDTQIFTDWLNEDGPKAMYQTVRPAITACGCTVIYPTEGQVISMAGVDFKFFNCDHSIYYPGGEYASTNYNDLSIGCYVTVGNYNFCDTADIGPVAQQKMVDLNGMTKANLYTATHHGWDNGTPENYYGLIPAWIKRLSPDVVISEDCAALDSRIMTNGAPMQSWCEKNGVPNYRSRINGTMYFKLNKHGWKFKGNYSRFVRDDTTWSSEQVSGATPTITAKAGVRYVCGEVTSLDFTPAATGISDVIFTSGSTPTVLTLPNTVRMPSWFVVEANTTYEINIADGVYGSVMSWT